MEFLRPATWEAALAAKAAHRDAVPIAGGTDVMVELNFDPGAHRVGRRRNPASGRRGRVVHPDHRGTG